MPKPKHKEINQPTVSNRIKRRQASKFLNLLGGLGITSFLLIAPTQITQI